MKKKLNSKHELNFNNYQYIRKDRPNTNLGGGTGIFIRNGIEFQKITKNTVLSLKVLELCIIKIPLSSGKSLFIILAYYPSGNNDSFLYIELQNHFESL